MSWQVSSTVLLASAVRHVAPPAIIGTAAAFIGKKLVVVISEQWQKHTNPGADDAQKKKIKEASKQHGENFKKFAIALGVLGSLSLMWNMGSGVVKALGNR